MTDDLTHGRGVFPSTLPASAGERRLALAVVIASAAMFLSALPFAQVRLAPYMAFIPIYQSALVVNDLITTILLLGQFSFLRSRGLLVLSSGYLFTAFMAVSHMLTFPGLFAPTGLLGAGPQSTAWLYMFWHGGFPMFVIVYALLEGPESEPSRPRGAGSVAVLTSVAAVLAAVVAITSLVTAGQGALPAIMRGNNYTPAMIVVVSSTWAASLIALVTLWWRRRPHTVLDLWLMVVMCAWLFDIALAAVFNAGRFDLGFYAGRIYGLLAASFVLTVLLIENGQLYARLVAALVDARRLQVALQDQNHALEDTVRERTERLLQSEKVATMGSLLAGVAHELNNPLAVVMGQTHLLRELAREPSLIQRAQKIHAAAERCARIVKNFLSLARQRPPERGEVRLNQLVEEAFELLAYELRTENVETERHLASDLPTLWADAHQLQQVLVNLIGNAHHAMRGSSPPRRITLTTRFNQGQGRAEVLVADSGPGIPAEIQKKIFEPFFTTKPPGQGTGLGLSLCRGIIAAHGGTLTVESEPGRGAAFRIDLPVLAQPVSTTGDPTPEAVPVVGARTILVVDDEPDIAATLAEALRHEGHEAHVATDGSGALEMLAQRSYDLVVSDTKMPGMDGMSMYREVLRRFPALRGHVIFVTGDVLDRDKQKFLDDTGAPVLTKPFDIGELRRVVRRTLATASPPAGER